MSLPKQVRQQIAEAQRIEGEIRAAAPVLAPAAVADSTTLQPQPSPAPQPAAAAPVPASAPQPDQKYEELMQQYRSLQGIHRTLVRANGEQQSRMQGLQAQHESLSAEVEKLRKAATAVPGTPIAPITPEEIKEFGPDLISVIERKTREVAAPLTQALNEANTRMENLAARNAELERQLTGVTDVQTKNATQAFEDRLRALVPNINVLNYDSKYLSWLSQVDPLDARKRTLQERLNEAVEYGDAEAAASFFRAYETLVAQAAAAAPKPNASLASQAQPASRAAPDSQQQPAGKMWSQAEITSFYDGVTRGRYTPQEKARIEGEIYKAQKDNRIAA